MVSEFSLKMIKKKWFNLIWTNLRYLILGVFLIVFVPLAMFYYYKFIRGYENVFTTSDVLGFYGAILSAAITVFIAIFTIQFIKKQIKRQAYVEREKEKWNGIEVRVADILTKINPLNLLLITVSDDISDITKTMGNINKYGLDCRIAGDCLTAYVSRDQDWPKIKELVDLMHSESEKFYEASVNLCNQYQKIAILKTRDMALDLLRKERENPGILSKDAIFQYTILVQQAEGLTSDSILIEIGDAKGKLTNLYEKEYRELLNLKGATFRLIMDEIDNRSMNILDDSDL